MGAAVQHIEMIGVEELLERFNELQSQNPKMEKQLRMIVRDILRKTTSDTRKAAKNGVMQSDLRHAYTAVKSLVYKRVFGGNVSILDRKKRSGYAASLPQTSSRSGYGGNRRKRSSRTEQIMSYWGADRAFILRWINDGTHPRQIKGSFNNPTIKNVGHNHGHSKYEHRNTGNRDKISARNWFAPASQSAMQKRVTEMNALIEDSITSIWEDETATIQTK